MSRLKNHETVNLSCRIDKNLYDLLLDQAKDQGISLNSLVNSIAKRHLTWERFSDDLGLIPVTKLTLKKIFRNLDDDTITKIANDVGGIVPRELLFLAYGKNDFDHLMKIIEVNGSRFGKVRHSSVDSVHHINIHHGICEEFSKFLAGTHQALADDLSVKLTIQNTDRYSINLEFSKPE